MNNRDELIMKAAGMPDRDKTKVILGICAYFEGVESRNYIESKNEGVTVEDFFKVLEERVEGIEKENS